MLSLLILAILFPISFRSATPVEGATKGATASTLTFTSNTSSTSASLSVSDTSGSFVSSSSNASFSIETNNATGYTLNIKTGNDTTTLSDGNNHTIPSIETSKTASNFTNNAWGLLPSKYEGSNNTTNYYPASSNGFTMDTTSSSNTGNANTYTIGLGLKADYTIPAGTYTNTTIVAEYVANPITYAIYYYSNTDDTVTGMPATNPQVPASSFPGTTATTTNLASAPTRTGYTFLGWCMGTSSSSNITVGTNGNADTCGDSSTNQFTAGQSFGINATGSSPDLYYFYAMWQAIIYTITIDNTNTTTNTNSLSILYGSSATVTVTPASGYYLSSVSCPSGVSCTGYGTGESYTGAQTITITNNTATTSSGTLSFVAEEPKVYMWDATFADCGTAMWDNRDGTERQYTTAEINGLCWMTQNLMLGASSSVTLSKATTNITDDTYTLPARGTYGTSYSGQYVWGNDTQCTDSSTTACAGYYSYAAATAGTNPNIGAASSDICPANWRLPTQAEFNTLIGTYTTGSALTGSPFLGVYAGDYYGSYFFDGGSRGAYWSSTPAGSSYAYSLFFNSSSASVYDGNHKFYGNGVRCVKEKPKLYDMVAAMSKGTQTAADLQATITTANSGVYEYNASVFGTASDAANTSKIYYYRGILDETVGSYGSDGDGKAWPNYVILQAGSSKATTDTCWRIVRTTGSGGVKMIYNGKWTGSTCANKQTAAQLTTKAFNGTSSTYQQIVRIGYTYNSTYATNTAKSGTIAQIFGTNSTPTVNNTRSDIKTYIEDTWYASNMTAWTSKLEASAGYCNDRTMNTSNIWTSPLAESSTIAATYGTSGLQAYYYGAYIRNATTYQSPSLTCAKYSNVDRSTVDLYRYVSGSTGVSNQLKYPAALLTADEVSFAGSGRSTATQGSSYHANSYLRSGSYFWLLSPGYRDSNGYAGGFVLSSNGNLVNGFVSDSYGVRPAISLVSGTKASSGSGTATDPWVVQ